MTAEIPQTSGGSRPERTRAVVIERRQLDESFVRDRGTIEANALGFEQLAPGADVSVSAGEIVRPRPSDGGLLVVTPPELLEPLGGDRVDGSPSISGCWTSELLGGRRGLAA